MTTLKVNSNNDLYISPANSMVLLTGIDATLQDCEHYVKSILGEMVFQADLGVDYFGTVFGEPVNLQAFRDSAITNIERVPGVVGVVSMDVQLVGSTVKYTAVIQTTFGVGTING